MDLQDQAQVVAALQRSRSNNELSALRAELKQMQDKEAAAPKCPYCFGAIVLSAVKCRHCASNIEWWAFQGETGPAKEGESKNIEALMHEEKREAIEAREKKEKEEFEAKLAELEKRFSLFCKECKTPHKLETLRCIFEVFHNDGLCSSCSSKKDMKTVYAIFMILAAFVFIIIIWHYLL
jgi:hypothetical protein